MPTTTLELSDDKKIQFITSQTEENIIDVQIYMCENDYIPQGKPLTTVLEGNEKEYHMKLRKDAHERGHFKPRYSTNPEWNPEI